MVIYKYGYYCIRMFSSSIKQVTLKRHWLLNISVKTKQVFQSASSYKLQIMESNFYKY